MPPSKVPETTLVLLTATEPVLPGMVVADAEVVDTTVATDIAATVPRAYQIFRDFLCMEILSGKEGWRWLLTVFGYQRGQPPGPLYKPVTFINTTVCRP